MATIVFTDEDEHFIESLGDGEFDPAKRLAHCRYRDLIPAESWDFLIRRETDSIRNNFRAALITLAAGVKGNCWEVYAGIAEDIQPDLDVEMVKVKSAITIEETVPMEIIFEFERAASALHTEAMNRVFAPVLESA